MIAAGMVVLAVGIVGCAQRDASLDESVGRDGWLTGDARTKFETVAEHLGGFSNTMVEVGYRYEVLYWAGRDGNWEFAAHQLEELEEAMELGLVRRPERQASSQPFLMAGIPGMEEAIANRDQAGFLERFETFRGHCNACHAMEKVSFIWIETPQQRVHSWGPRRAER